MARLCVRRTKRQGRGSDIIVFADARLDLLHDEALGFGGYITDESRYAAFAKDKVTFKPLCPIDFTTVEITPEGDFYAEGSIRSELALFPGLVVPIILRGEDIFLRFPVPTDKLSFGPVRVTDAALDLGVGANGFFVRGTAGIAVDRVGRGTLTARGENEDVVGDRRAALDEHLAAVEVDAPYLGHHRVDVGVALDDAAQVWRDVVGREPRRGDLVEQGRERVEVVAVDEGDLHRVAGQRLGRSHPSETATDDDDALGLRLRRAVHGDMFACRRRAGRTTIVV
jgi:hypothetical protein